MICCQPCNERERQNFLGFFIYEDKNVDDEYVLFANKLPLTQAGRIVAGRFDFIW